jgi:dTDP-4-amino-4,6-dideoxygalactose transaminase
MFGICLWCVRKRNELQEYLTSSDIQTLIHYPIPPHQQEAYKSLGVFQYQKNTSRFFEFAIKPSNVKDDIDQVINSFKSLSNE